MLDVDICNQALYRLGEVNPITSMDERSAEAETLRSVYGASRDALLSAFPWPWAKRVVPLALLSAESHPFWRYTYAYPPGCLRVLALFNEVEPARYRGESELPTEYELTSGASGRRILSNLDGARCTYIHRVEDPLLWDPLFRQAFIARLAADVALPITGSDTRMRELQDLAQRAYYSAIASMAAESREYKRRRGRYVKARR